MMKKIYGYVSESMSCGRIVAHGKITDLSSGFELPGGIPFSIYVRPKGTEALSGEVDMLMDVKCYQEDRFSPAPFGLQEWSPLALSAIAPDNGLLESFDIFWGSGNQIREPQ